MIDLARLEADLASLTKAERELNGTFLQRTVVDTAAALGYRWSHWRPLQNRRGIWQVPVEGTLGRGWPDLFLAHEQRRVALGLEIKSWADWKRNGIPPAQVEVLELLALCGIRTAIITAADIREPLAGSRLLELLVPR